MTGLLLGSFDPPHIGHVYMAAAGLNAGLEKIKVIPCWANPTKQGQTDFMHRYFMCHIAFNDLPNVEVDPIDGKLQTTYTYEFLQQCKFKDISIIVGADIDITTWKNGKWILDNYPITKIDRLGYSTNNIGIQCSSTDLRNMLKNKQYVFPFISTTELNYIKQNHLYGY